MIYCIERTPELDEKQVFHEPFDKEPTLDDIEDRFYEVYGIEINISYEKIEWYKVSD